MEAGPPLNLSTSVKVEDCFDPNDVEDNKVEIRNELVKHVGNDNSTYVLLQPVTDGNETLTITGEAVHESFIESSKASISDDIENSNLCNSGNKNKTYRCSHCSETFQRATQLRTHEKIHVEDKVHECDKCPEIFSRLSLLVQHRQEHAKVYSCSECNLSLNSYTSFRLHMKNHKNERKFKCSHCSMSFSQQSHLITHLRKHTGEKPFICPMCSTRFKQVSHLTTHLRTHTNDRPYVCDLCNAAFSQTGSLKRHKRSHTGEKPFKCVECNAVFVEKRNLNRHLLSHSGVRPFKCDLCTVSFTQLIDLKRHTMSHSGIKPFKCDICEASFSRKNNLKWHKLTHEGDTPHICEVCNVGFRIARDLKNHKRNHSENKPYSCNQCNSSFSQITTLKRHSLVHSGQKHFSCQECKASFFEKSALKRHVQRHANNKPFSCDLCLTSFLEARTLKRHKIVMHSEGKYGDNSLGEENLGVIGEIKVDTGIVKNLMPVADEENSLHIYEPVHQKSQKIEPVPDIPVSRNDVLPHSATSEIYINAINPQNASQQPTLVLTEPGKPPKTGRPANNCQNHSSHVHTLLEGSYNPWQTWCFCDPPNIPLQAGSSELSSASSQPLILNSTSPNSSQSSSQPLEFHSNDMLSPVLAQQQQISVHSLKVTNNIHGTSSSLSQSVNKGHFGGQVSNKITAQVPQFSNSQIIYQSSDGYQHYSESTNCTSDMSLINDCQKSVNGHEQRIIESSQRITSQGSKPSYLHIPSDEIISSSFSSLSSHDDYKKQFSFEKEPCKMSSQVSQARDTIINSTQPAISKGESLDNTSHASVIMVANESSKHCSHVQNQNSDKNSFAEGPSQIVSMNSNMSVPAYKEFSPNDVPHEMNYQHSIQIEPDHRKIECTSEQSVGKTQNVMYEQLPQDCSNKNQVTLQYSLTVNNPATGEIQIQSDLFSAKSPVSSGPKQKNKKIVKYPITQDKKLNCSYCPKTFVKQGPLEMHIRTHTGEKPFICGICSQQFSHNNSLTIHMRSHTGERPYTCIYCGATFTQKSNLRVHHRTHTGEKPFKCNICEVSFSQGSHLKAHIRIHNNDRPYVCSICGQAFTQRSALKRHQMKHTGMKPHSCNECDSKFSQKDDLRRHQSNHNLKSKSVLNNKKKKNAKSNRINKDYPKATKHSSVSSAENCPNSSESNELELNNTDAGRSTDSSEVKMESSLVTVKESNISEEAAVQKDSSNPIEPKLNKEEVKRNVMEISSSLKMPKSKPRSHLVEPSRISRRIKEAAERKKLKIEDSDFITGDLEEIDLAEEMEDSLIKATQVKVGKKKDGNKKMYSDGVVQSWCFCEVPHGPNEPHTHVEVSKSVKKCLGIEKASVIIEPTTIVPLSTNVTKNEDYREGALQFGLQQISNTVMLQGEQVILQREHSPTHLSENLGINSGATLSDVHIISNNNDVISSSIPSTVETSSMPTSSNSLNASQVHVNHLPVVEMEDGKAIYTSAQIISAQVLSGGQFITPDGTFFIEAGDIINNGTVVLNSTTPGTFYFDLGADGQFVNVPVSVGTSTMGQDTQVLVPATTIVEGNNHVYSPSTQTVSIHSDTNNFSDHIEATLLDNSQRSSSVFPNSINNNMLSSLQSSSEQVESFPTSQIENLQYTSLDNNELTLFNPNVDFQTLTNVVVKEEKAKKVKKSKTSLPIVVNPCKCSVCGKVFAQKVTLRTHMEEVHKGLQYCGICFDAFTSKEHLSTHKLQHQSQSFACSECSHTFETKNALTQHKNKLHNIGRYADVKKEQRAFMCNQCDSRFYQRSDLKRHSLGHTGEKPFKCWQCGAGFTRKYSLKKHERIHTGEKPYNCHDCDQSFAYRHQYNRHLATHPAVEELTTDPNILAIPLSHVLS